MEKGLPRVIPVTLDEFITPAARLTLPAQLLPHSPSLVDLLAACGVSPEVLSDAAPAYDKWNAVCASFDLMPRHLLVSRLHRLTSTLGYRERLTAGTASSSWSFLSETLWAEDVTLDALALKLGERLTRPVRPDLLLIGQTVPEGAEGLEGAVEKALDAADGASPVLLLLGKEYAFTRPNPYRAGQLMKQAQAGGAFSWDALDAAGRDHLLTQLIRVTGAVCRRRGRRLCTAGGTAQLTPLCAYLAASGCLPDLLRLLTDPEDAESPLPAMNTDVSVRDGLFLYGDDTPLTVSRRLTAYAERMPLLCADTILTAVRTPTDLAAPAMLRRALNDFADEAGREAPCTPEIPR